MNDEVTDSVFDQVVTEDFHSIWDKIGFDLHKIECDDREGLMTVGASCDGDLHLALYPTEGGIHMRPSFRARTFLGGGHNRRVRTALMLLALAIKEDSEGNNEC